MFQFQIKSGDGWRSVHPTRGAPYEFATLHEANRMARICYPDHAVHGLTRVVWVGEPDTSLAPDALAYLRDVAHATSYRLADVTQPVVVLLRDRGLVVLLYERDGKALVMATEAGREALVRAAGCPS